jgi:hypothetical protein
MVKSEKSPEVSKLHVVNYPFMYVIAEHILLEGGKKQFSGRLCHVRSCDAAFRHSSTALVL